MAFKVEEANVRSPELGLTVGLGILIGLLLISVFVFVYYPFKESDNGYISLEEDEEDSEYMAEVQYQNTDHRD
eukprot:Awhi_evm1s1786